MIMIRKAGGIRDCYIKCDKCVNGIDFNGDISISQMEKVSRSNGWTAGKYNLCPECKQTKGKKARAVQ
jgi:hypothetical protein